MAVVEDDMDFQRTLCEAICGAPGLRGAGASNSQAQAFELIERGRFDVLLVDPGLPDGSGIDVIRAAHTRLPGKPVGAGEFLPEHKRLEKTFPRNFLTRYSCSRPHNG